MSKIVVVVGNPFTNSLSHGLAASYVSAATSAGAEVRVLDLAQLKFPAVPENLNQVRVRGIDQMDDLDPVIAKMVRDIEWAELITFVYPVWWGTFPGVLKAFFDRVFLSGVAFKYGKTSAKWDKLWRGKTARLILTMDTPPLWHRLTYKAPGENAMRWATFWYVGIKTIGVTRFSPIRASTPEIRHKWMVKVANLATKDARK